MTDRPSSLTDRDRKLLFGEDTLREGDAVVHFEHGLARYGGETRVEVEGETQHLTVFVYRHGGKLMLPAEEGRDFWAYGAPADDVSLDRLKAGDWTARRDEMIAELRRDAARLRERSDARRAREAPRIVPDEAVCETVAEGFGHEPTEDQAAAFDAVLDGLARDVPMNRLVIGDVGFGKTEVAVRAAAAVASAGRQVAIAAPTTILARQHVETLRDRLAPVGIAVEELSRMTPAGARDALLERIASGEARVVVGTSALLAEDVAFADLALAIVDEEQKFGRDQKRDLRRLSEGCHRLDLTATPIPRSLAMAEIGLLDVSVLATPPRVRKRVETDLARPSAAALRHAIEAEIARDGQVFVVCPRIEGMEEIESLIAEAAPDVPLAVAHGQMPEADLEDRMGRFTGGEARILLSTAIVENGLDVPRANAMIVFEAERFGLTQLHQLRGRIGRGDVAARMLLLSEVDPLAEEDDAAKRLTAFAETTGIGGGFDIARMDRNMRGFGTLDGAAQSGQVSRLGLGLYRHVLRGAMPQDASEAAAG